MPPFGRNALPVIGIGGDRPAYSGNYGSKRPRLTLQAAVAKPAQHNPFTGPSKITAATVNNSGPEHSHSDSHSESPWHFQAADGEQSTEASRKQQAKQQQDLLWKERQPEHRFRRFCYLAHEQQRRQSFQQYLRADFASRISGHTLICQNCSTAEHLHPVLPAAPITFAGISGYVTVDNPEYMCCACGRHTAVHPISVGCFPATPSRPEVWYDDQLLALTAAAQHAGPLAVQAHSAALQQLYLFNGLDLSRPAVWDNLGMAAQQWKRVEVCTFPCSCAVCIQFMCRAFAYHV